MTMKIAAKASFALAAVVAMTSSHVAGEDAPASRKATLQFRIAATPAGSATFDLGGVADELAEGQSTTQRGQVKLFPAAGASPCPSNIGFTFGPNVTPEGTLPLWEVEGEVRRVEMDKIQVGYVWKRWSGSRSGPAPDASDRGEATVPEGRRVLLDFVPVSEASSGCYRNLTLELSASIPEDPAFKDRRIAHDLWLVSEDHGKRLTRRLQLIGKQGEDVAFDYGTFRSKLSFAPRPDQGADVVEMAVTGAIRGRIQLDGSIEILLAAARTATPGDHHWATAAHGEKRVRATPGETLRLELPPPAPFAGVNEPDTFRTIAEQHVALILTPTILD